MHDVQRTTVGLLFLTLLLSACGDTAPGFESTPLTCTDGQDNDDDGLLDCADPECADQPVCIDAAETPVVGTDLGVDPVDRADAGIPGAEASAPDGGGDYPDGATPAVDSAGPVADSIADAGAGRPDTATADAGIADAIPADATEPDTMAADATVREPDYENTAETCSDSKDNDLDRLIDCDDPDCRSAGHCPAVCGDGRLDASERCDTALRPGTPGACPSSCDDGNACTTDRLVGEGSCDATCTHPSIVDCRDSDGCCPTGCRADNDSDCSPSCGNGVVESGERCDTQIPAASPGACPTSCDDKNACTADQLLNGGTCGAVCAFSPITQCRDRDGCCPSGCHANNDSDCSPSCGNGVVESGERCDTEIPMGAPGQCPTSCNDDKACTADQLLNGGTCGAVCAFNPITQCRDRDGCCPAGCNANTDSDCSPSCGNGAVELGERCDTALQPGQRGACPNACIDRDACTADVLLNAGTCGAICVFNPIAQCESGDGCCPAGCNANDDGDCEAECGNAVVEEGERCDIEIASNREGACPTACDDRKACTLDTLVGGQTCGAYCRFTPIKECGGLDGCCPAGCNANNDGDCKPECGNGVLEKGERCDIRIPAGRKGSCPTSCDDGNACTSEKLADAGTCQARCESSPPRVCLSTDYCQVGECEPKSGRCVFRDRSCDDRNLCTVDRCSSRMRKCVNQPISCDDGNRCTADSCIPSTGKCVHLPICLTKVPLTFDPLQ
jgi:hypothetical protein